MLPSFVMSQVALKSTREIKLMRRAGALVAEALKGACAVC